MDYFHNVDDEGAESDVVRALRRDDKYALVAWGKDTQMVRKNRNFAFRAAYPTMGGDTPV